MNKNVRGLGSYLIVTMVSIKFRDGLAVAFLLVLPFIVEIENISLIDFKTDDWISHYGYIPERHQIITDDGYNLTVFRCNSNKSSSSLAGKKEVVVIQHGIVCSSDDFTMNLPHQSLAYVMADAGYDVWLPNHRGNFYSRQNLFKDPDDPASGFWDFAFDDIGLKDYPPTFQYIRNITNQTKLFVISYSQATTSMLALLAEKPEFNDQIHAMSLMAPIGYLSNFKFLATLRSILPENTFTALRDQEVVARTKAFVQFCKSYIGAYIVETWSSGLFGRSINERNNTMLPIYASHTPAGTSTTQFKHYWDMYTLGFFGPQIRGTTNETVIPSNYPLHQVTAPVSLHHSTIDRISNPTDVKKLISKLNGTSYLHVQMNNRLNHIDFQWGRNAAKIVYSDILKFFAQVLNKD